MKSENQIHRGHPSTPVVLESRCVDQFRLHTDPKNRVKYHACSWAVTATMLDCDQDVEQSIIYTLVTNKNHRPDSWLLTK